MGCGIFINNGDSFLKMTETKEQASKRGKKSRRDGANFERAVRKDLEKKGWIVSRWCNNVEFEELRDDDGIPWTQGKLVPAKSTRFRSNTHGFPDFILFKMILLRAPKGMKLLNSYNKYDIRGIECKSNGYLSKEEKEKAKWLLENNIFSKFLIAKKGQRGEIIYDDFR